MQVCKTRKELDAFLGSAREAGKRIGFVPTMGALHEGHLSLAALAQEHSDTVIASIFVNPTQFGEGEDFETYPRDLDKDLGAFKAAGVAAVYAPDVTDIYPDGAASDIKAGDAARGLESDFRPHFFDGVCSVVKRLFEAVRPDIAVFGEKDFQQLMVIDEMAQTLDLGIEVIGAPIIRGAHGLALSSRNAYLGEDELGIARMLNQAIYKAASDIDSGTEPQQAVEEAKAMLLTAGFDKVDYVAYRIEWGRVLAAAWVGTTRLIDNCAITDRWGASDA